MSKLTFQIDLDALRAAPAPLYYRYPDIGEPQPGIIQMDEHGVVTVGSDDIVGPGQPGIVGLRRTLRWSVPYDVRGDALADLLELDDVRALLARVHAGHSVQWDGENHSGRLTAGARAASEELDEVIQCYFGDDAGRAQIWRVGDWLFAGNRLPALWSDQPLAEAVAALESEAAREGIVLDGDVRQALLDEALHWYRRDDESLTAVQLKALIDAGLVDACAAP